MQDTDTLEAYGIQSGSTVDVSGRLLGGYIPVVAEAPSKTALDTVQNIWLQITTKLKELKEDINRNVDKAQEKIKEMANRALKITRFQMIMARAAFMYAQFMSTMFRFFPIIVLVTMVLGFFTKPLEFIMLFIACITLAIIYVIYFILSIPGINLIPFLVWFVLFDVVPLVAYTIVMGALFLVITLFCLVLWVINWMTGGALNSLVLCQNTPAAWYKTPNYHMGNKYERGLFCSRECFPGYYPDDTGMFCIKTPMGTPSYCPQAQAMRLYTNNRSDLNYIYKDYPVMGNMKYFTKSPEERERLIKKHFIKRKDFLDKCEKSMRDVNYVPLNICASLDATDASIDATTLKKLKQVCSQAYCNSKSNYGFCPQLEGAGAEDDTDFWKRIIHLTIMVIVFMFVLTFTLCYMAGISMNA